jgi:diguanylate cyclase (GGDEF)-like protein/PAS domain S-box-containing protein
MILRNEKIQLGFTMKQRISHLLDLITHWPNGFIVLEVAIVSLGLITGLLLYDRSNQLNTAAKNARLFDQQTNRILTSVNLADIHFSELLTGNSQLDITQDVYTQLDTADSLCANIDTGGPNGLFRPVPAANSPENLQITPLCGQLQTFRGLIQQRWQDYQNSRPDSQKTAYGAAYREIIVNIQRFSGVTNPHVEETENNTRITNLILSIGLSVIFFLIAIMIWFSQRSLRIKTKTLQAEVELRNRLNTDLDSERNLLNALLDNVPSAVFAKDNEKRFLIANSAAARVMGVINKDALLGHTEADFQPAEIAEKVLADDSHILATGDKLLGKQETLMDLYTGKPHWRQTTKVPLRDGKGQIYGLVGISWDITKEKENAEALKKANDDLIKVIVSLEQSARETENLSEMVDLLQACPNMEEACVVIAGHMRRFFPEDSGMLYLLNSARTLLELAASWGASLSDPEIFKPEECWGMRRGKLHIVKENNLTPSQDENDPLLICPHITPIGPADYLCVPLVAHGEALGLLHLRHLQSPDGATKGSEEWYDHEKRQRVRSIVGSLSLALANLLLRSTLQEQSIRDPLTGMFNRRFMEESLEREILRATRSKQTVGVIMLDIDQFKNYNDTYGHQTGDAMLTSLGHFLSASVRGEDIACRYGGEEFILILPGASLDDTQKRAEELREKVHFVDVTYQGELHKTVTFSLGISVFPQNGTTAEQLIKNADLALYRAKSEGRDRVAVA